jgi:hypothetical protein
MNHSSGSFNIARQQQFEQEQRHHLASTQVRNSQESQVLDMLMMQDGQNKFPPQMFPIAESSNRRFTATSEIQMKKKPCTSSTIVNKITSSVMLSSPKQRENEY